MSTLPSTVGFDSADALAPLRFGLGLEPLLPIPDEVSSRRLDFEEDTLIAYRLVGMLTPPKHSERRPRRSGDRTRERLLTAAFREVYRSGFQSAGLDTILAAAGVTKGALYHYFDSKEALGHALVEEIIAELTRETWLRPLHSTEEPIHALIGIVEGTSLRPADVRGGCPLNNLAQEMSPLDEGFRKHLAGVFRVWQEAIATALQRGQSRGTVRPDLDPDEAATFLIAMYEGYLSLAKNAHDVNVLKVGIRNIVRWLSSLRAQGNQREHSSDIARPAGSSLQRRTHRGQA